MTFDAMEVWLAAVKAHEGCATQSFGDDDQAAAAVIAQAFAGIVAERDALRDQLAKAEGALQFYAREYTWKSATSYMCGHGAIACSAMVDQGGKARAYFAAQEPKP